MPTLTELKPGTKEAMVDYQGATVRSARLYQLPSNAEHLEALAQQEKEGRDLTRLFRLCVVAIIRI